MEIIIYRHAEPLVTGNEIIFGHDFPLWVLRYNESGIVKIAPKGKKEKIVFTSNLKRSIETGKHIGREIIQSPVFREAEVPLIKFPSIQINAKYWLSLSRVLWLLGLQTKCESFRSAKQRATQIVEKLSSKLSNHQRVVLVGHGFMNGLVKKELIHRDWSLTKIEGGNGFLAKMTFVTEQDVSPERSGSGVLNQVGSAAR